VYVPPATVSFAVVHAGAAHVPSVFFVNTICCPLPMYASCLIVAESLVDRIVDALLLEEPPEARALDPKCGRPWAIALAVVDEIGAPADGRLVHERGWVVSGSRGLGVSVHATPAFTPVSFLSATSLCGQPPLSDGVIRQAANPLGFGGSASGFVFAAVGSMAKSMMHWPRRTPGTRSLGPASPSTRCERNEDERQGNAGKSKQDAARHR
jgi:hypothetical protein